MEHTLSEHNRIMADHQRLIQKSIKLVDQSSQVMSDSYELLSRIRHDRAMRKLAHQVKDAAEK